MDEQRVSQAFRDAVQELPPASFEHHDVVAASRHATRRRSMIAGGTLLGAVVLLGGSLAGNLVLRNETAETAAPAPGSQAETLRTLDAPRCGPINGELVTALTAVLANRGKALSGQAGEVPKRCPAGSRAAALPVTGGVLHVLLVPQGVPKGVDTATPDGARSFSVTLQDGRTLAVISTPGAPGLPAPLADELPDLARELALRAS